MNPKEQVLIDVDEGYIDPSLLNGIAQQIVSINVKKDKTPDPKDFANEQTHVIREQTLEEIFFD